MRYATCFLLATALAQPMTCIWAQEDSRSAGVSPSRKSAPVIVRKRSQISDVQPAGGEQRELLSAEWHFGTELFQMLLEESGLEITQHPVEVLQRPKNSVIVLIGDLRSVAVAQQMARFVRQGGACLAATDIQCRIRGVFSVSGERIGSPIQQYRSYSDVLLLANIKRPHPLAANLSKLVVNQSSWIDQVDNRLGEALALVNAPSAVSPRLSRGRPIVCTVPINSSPSARLVLASDHSLFTNGMLWHGDNAMLAINACKYLTEGNRDRLLFIHNGQPLVSFRDQLPASQPNAVPPNIAPNLTPDQLVQVLNKTVAKVEDSDLLNALVADRPRRMSTRHYYRGLLFALAAGLIGIAFYYLFARSQPPSSQPGARRMRAPHAFGADESPRNPDGIQRFDAARLIASDLMTRLTGSTDPAQWQQSMGNTRVQNADDISTWKASGSPELERVLQMATSIDTKPISRKTLLAFSQTVEELSQRLVRSVAAVKQ